ncbi:MULTISPECIES: G5 domain-containing protein [unclassified Bacillus (in: firmicutes)]|uniref:G5 domain-containing protein n=1 Tax=unclassified Bacillus (in: firmicutes) TaxID=185979 RepID=UPI0008F238A6|nr:MULTISPECIES: G5 domain-containing protein [unclassified Bacillus (in: firmicutes)]SFB16333.1 VanW like protein [Bacillus sp. UNCCL13]SFQ78119.1 VanW like protein [Bacillus sp. cl95]
MKKTGQAIKLFLVLVLCTTYFLGFSRYGAKAFQSINGVSDVYPAGTVIGNISMEGKTAEEAKSELTNKYADWVKNATLSLQFKEKNVPMNVENFHFNIEESVNAVVAGKETPLMVTLEKGVVLETMSQISSDLDEKTMNVNRLLDELTSIASRMAIDEKIVSLSEFLLAKENKSDTISEVVIQTKEAPEKIDEIAAKLYKVTIPSQATFSLLDYAKEQGLENAPSSTMSIIASGIYEAILPTNFSIIERNIGQELPAFADLGFEAKIDSSNHLDLGFSNPNTSDYMVELQWNGQELSVKLVGEALLYDYKIVTKNKADYEPKTIKQYSPHLATGQKKVKQKGEKGYMITVHREIYDNGQLLKTEPISEDFYAPVPQIEIHALPAVPVTPGTTTGTNATGTSPDVQQPVAGTTTTPNTNLPLPTDQQNQTGPTGTTSVSEATETPTDDNLWGKPNEQPK